MIIKINQTIFEPCEPNSWTESCSTPFSW